MDDKIRQSVSEFLKKYRTQRKLTQEQLAEKLNYSSKMIANWEQEKCDIPRAVIIKLRNESGQSLDEIFGLKDKLKLGDFDDVDEYVINLCFDYARDLGNLNYTLYYFDNITDSDDLYEMTVDIAFSFLEDMMDCDNCIREKIGNDFTGLKIINEEIIAHPVFMFLIRNGYIKVEYNDSTNEKGFIVKYLIDTQLCLALEFLYWKHVKRTIGSDVSEDLTKRIDEISLFFEKIIGEYLKK